MRSIVHIPMMALLLSPLGPAAHASSSPDPAQTVEMGDETPESRGVARALVVAHLVDWARANRDPAALLTAARMLAEVPMRTGPGGDVGLEPVLTPEALLQEAAALGDARLELDDMVVTGSRLRSVQPPAEAVEPPPPPPPPRPIAPPPLSSVRGADLDSQAAELARNLVICGGCQRSATSEGGCHR
jgi:hypothetical protein